MIEKPYSIFAETNDYLVVIKNASVPSSKGLTPNSVSELVEKDFPEIALVQGKKQNDGGLVHRLDTETSGLMLFAKNQGFSTLCSGFQYGQRTLCLRAGMAL